MSEAGGKWAFVKPCGCVYGLRWDIDEEITTPIQAWALFYAGQPKDRKKAEAAGCTTREWQDGDHLTLPEECPHVTGSVSALF